jgi:glucose dehydrogenase
MKTFRTRAVLAAMLGLAVAGLAACQLKNGKVDEARLEAAVGNGDWISVGRTQDEQHFSPMSAAWA